MHENTKVKLIELAAGTAATIATLAVLGVVFYIASRFYEDWRFWGVVAAEFALLVLIYHAWRWLRFPGLFESKSASRLLFEIFFSIVFVYSLPLIALLAKFHLSRLLPIKKIAFKLGLEFKFTVRQLVHVSPHAPFNAGEVGRIKNIRVSNSYGGGLQPGEVVYGVQIRGESVEVSEKYLFPSNSSLETHSKFNQIFDHMK